MDAGQADLDFAIIGAQKSASTFLHKTLLGHPQIDIPSEESRNFEDPYYAAGGVANLEALFGPRKADVRRGIKRPDHLADPAVPARIVAATPDVRVLAVLRDPVRRAVSAYFHYARLGFLPLLPLDDAFGLILDGSWETKYPRAGSVIEYGLYGKHLQRWLEYLERDRLLVLRHQDLEDTAELPIREALRFLDVDEGPASRLAATARANQTSYSLRRVRVQRSRNRFMFDYSPDRYRRTRRSMGPIGFTLAGAATVLDERILARFDRHLVPRLRPDLERRLRALYTEDEIRLRALIGVRLWESPTAGPA